MADILGAGIATVNTLVSLANKVTNGPSGDFTHLSISNPNYGTINLEGFEIPSSLPLGGDQRVIVSQYVGLNRREVQILGAQPRPLGWKGAFLYGSAMARAKYFDLVRASGEAVTISWGDFTFSAVVESFHFDPINIFHIPYDISLQVIQPSVRSNDLHKGNPPTSLDTVQSGVFGLLSSLQGLISTVSGFAFAYTAFQKGGINGIVSGISSLSTALGSASSLVGLDTTTIMNYVNQTKILASTAGLIATELSNSKSFGAPSGELFNIQSDMFMLGNLLASTIQPVSSLSQTLVKDNLFRIAQTFYGGIDGVWEKLADANNLKSSQLLGPQTVQLVPINGVSPVSAPPGSVAGTSYESGFSSVPRAEQDVA